jgi:hypothetical protein
MKLAGPYPVELLRVARKVVWYDAPQQTLEDIPTFLAQLMVYGSPADVEIVGRYLPIEEFRDALIHAPAGVFTEDAWTRWHKRLGLAPIPALPRRRFPGGLVGPEAGRFFGR